MVAVQRLSGLLPHLLPVLHPLIRLISAGHLPLPPPRAAILVNPGSVKTCQVTPTTSPRLPT